MKKNERLFNILENMPDRYIESAYEDKAVKPASRIQWKAVFSVAACFAVIAAVPVLIHSQNKNNPEHNISPAVSQITETDVSEQPEKISENNSEILNRQSETASEGTTYDHSELIEKLKEFSKTELLVRNYTDNKNLLNLDSNNYYTVNFLKNKDFQASVNDDIRNAMDDCAKYYDESYMTGIRQYSSDTEILEKTKAIRADCILLNGYMSFNIYYFSYPENNTEHLHTLTYDVINERKITDYSELFGDKDYRTKFNSVYREASGEDIDLMPESPELFTVSDFYGINDRYVSYYQYNEIFDSADFLPNKYRDISGAFEEEYTITELYYHDFFTKQNELYLFKNFDRLGNYNEEINDILTRLEKKSLENAGISNVIVSAIRVPYIGGFNFWQVDVSKPDSDGTRTFLYDPVTEKELTLKDIIASEHYDEICDESYDPNDPDRNYFYMNGLSISTGNSVEHFTKEYIKSEYLSGSDIFYFSR